MKISQTKNMPEPELQHNLKLTFKRLFTSRNPS